MLTGLPVVMACCMLVVEPVAFETSSSRGFPLTSSGSKPVSRAAAALKYPMRPPESTVTSGSSMPATSERTRSV